MTQSAPAHAKSPRFVSLAFGVLTCLAVLHVPRVQASEAVWLVTAQEMLQYQGPEGYALPPMLRTRQPQPSIEVLKPDIADGKPIQGPLAIHVRFIPAADSRIRPESFKALYGALKLDITSRLLGMVQITPEGFTLNQAEIPKGKHRILLQVADERNRIAERDLRLIID